MTAPNRRPKLDHVGAPLKRVAVSMEPTEPLVGPVTDGPLVRAGRPLVHPAHGPTRSVVLTRRLLNGEDADRIDRELRGLAARVNESRALRGRPGVFVSAARSAGAVGVLLDPSEPGDSAENLYGDVEALAAFNPTRSAAPVEGLPDETARQLAALEAGFRTDIRKLGMVRIELHAGDDLFPPEG